MTISSESKVAFIYSNGVWYPLNSASVNTAATYGWTGSHTFDGTTTFSNSLVAKAGVNNFQNPSERDASIASPSSGVTCFVRQDVSGNVINQIQYYHNGSWIAANNTSIVSDTNSRILSMADAGAAIKISNSTDLEVIVPANSSVALPIGSTFELIRYGSGELQVTTPVGSGVTINSKSNYKALTAQYSVAKLMKIGTDEWILSGDIKAAVVVPTPVTPTPVTPTPVTPTPVTAPIPTPVVTPTTPVAPLTTWYCSSTDNDGSTGQFTIDAENNPYPSAVCVNGVSTYVCQATTYPAYPAFNCTPTPVVTPTPVAQTCSPLSIPLGGGCYYIRDADCSTRYEPADCATPTPVTPTPVVAPTPVSTLYYGAWCDGTTAQTTPGFSSCSAAQAFAVANSDNGTITNWSCQQGSVPALPTCVTPTPVTPTPVTPTPVTPTPVTPTPVTPTPVTPTPVTPTPVTPTPVTQSCSPITLSNCYGCGGIIMGGVCVM